MDRRTLLALALTAVAVMLFQVFYFAPAERAANEKRQKELIVRRAADSLRIESGSVSDTTSLGVPSPAGAALSSREWCPGRRANSRYPAYFPLAASSMLLAGPPKT